MILKYQDFLLENSQDFTFYLSHRICDILSIIQRDTKNPKIRNILNLETCISVVAAFYYSQFVDDLQEGVNYEKINLTRYVDWSITTPIMLLVLVLALLFNNKKGPMKFTNYLIILFFNYVMLGFGYAGEIGMLDKTFANILGFGGFAGLYYFIYDKYIKNFDNKDNKLLFISFLILWALYGVFYMLDDVTRNVGYNVLDLLSKCFVGIFFWAYYSGVFKL